MRKTQRIALVAAALSLALAPATAAAAKPVSTHSVSVVWDGVRHLTVTEGGTLSLSYRVTSPCAGAALASEEWTATRAPATVSFVTDRKMNQASVVAVVTVDHETRDCDGVVSSGPIEITVSVDAVATDRTDRTRNANGDRVLSRDADVTIDLAGTAIPTRNGDIIKTITK